MVNCVGVSGLVIEKVTRTFIIISFCFFWCFEKEKMGGKGRNNKIERCE